VAYHHEPCGCELCTVLASVPGPLALGPDGPQEVDERRAPVPASVPAPS